MQLSYHLQIENPQHHYVKVRIKGQRAKGQQQLTFFMPAWSPGSYMIREYARNVRHFWASNTQGEVINFRQVHKDRWQLDWSQSELKNDRENFEVTYEVYCHELTVRTSHVDASHAFIQGPSVFMGVLDEPMQKLRLQVSFPPMWSKISTALKDVSQRREEFCYEAEDYDQLIDMPLEIGCQETDGFRVQGKDHELAFYGVPLNHGHNLKADMQTIVEQVAQTMDRELPYEKYTFITHFVPGKYGGLEHQNSTALHFCAKKLGNRKDYLRWLSLVAHEYFHTWNVKRIRPRELGPFNYQTEAMTSMLWLAEGLTSFMDELFVYRANLCNLEEYLEMQKDNLNQYLSIPGKKFHSLEDSSFNAWVKLYRPDENSNNSSISYYLKGGIVFWLLNVGLVEQGSGINQLLSKLWQSYLKRPQQGLTSEEVYQMVSELGGQKLAEQFQVMVSTTEDLELENYFQRAGLKLHFKSEAKPWLGLQPEFRDERVFVSSVTLDGPGHRGGFNAGDEIIAIDGIRVLKGDFQDLSKILKVENAYRVTVSRLDRLLDLSLTPSNSPRLIEKITVQDEALAQKMLLAKN